MVQVFSRWSSLAFLLLFQSFFPWVDCSCHQKCRYPQVGWSALRWPIYFQTLYCGKPSCKQNRFLLSQLGKCPHLLNLLQNYGILRSDQQALPWRYPRVLLITQKYPFGMYCKSSRYPWKARQKNSYWAWAPLFQNTGNSLQVSAGVLNRIKWPQQTLLAWKQ